MIYGIYDFLQFYYDFNKNDIYGSLWKIAVLYPPPPLICSTKRSIVINYQTTYHPLQKIITILQYKIECIQVAIIIFVSLYHMNQIYELLYLDLSEHFTGSRVFM